MTQDDWNKVIKHDSCKILDQIVSYLNRKRINSEIALNIMDLEGINQIDIFNLKNALKKLYPKINEDQAIFISRYLAKGS